MDSEILDQLTNLEKSVDSKVTKPKRGRKKNAKINEVKENDVRDKRERPVACALSGNSKQYLGKGTLNSKLTKWTAITLIYCQIDANLF